MNNDTDAPMDSPDFLAVPKKGKGTKKLNKVPMFAVLAAIILFGVVVLYTMSDKINATARTGSSTGGEIDTVTRFATPPIARPADPVSVAVPMEPMQVSMDGTPIALMSEAEKQTEQRRIAAYESALSAKTGVESFSSRRQTQQSRVQPISSPPVPSIGEVLPHLPMRTPMEDDDQMGGDNQQKLKREFTNLHGNGGSPYLKHTRVDAMSPYEIKAGSVIPGVLLSGISSVLPGQITGQVRSNVYDSATGRYLLIPAGSRIVGTYESSISAGQERIFVAWNRIIFPDSSSIFLDAMPGADQTGMAGFQDQVNNHYVRTFGQAFLLSLFAAGIQLSQPAGAVSGTYNAQQIGAAAIGQQMGQLGMQIARRNLNMQPTLEIRPGFNFTIAVNKDMVMKPWTGHPLAVARN